MKRIKRNELSALEPDEICTQYVQNNMCLEGWKGCERKENGAKTRGKLGDN